MGWAWPPIPGQASFREEHRVTCSGNAWTFSSAEKTTKTQDAMPALLSRCVGLSPPQRGDVVGRRWRVRAPIEAMTSGARARCGEAAAGAQGRLMSLLPMRRLAARVESKLVARRSLKARTAVPVFAMWLIVLAVQMGCCSGSLRQCPGGS